MGPSVLDNNVILKNVGSGIKWESLEEIESATSVGLLCESEVLKCSKMRDWFVVGRRVTSKAGRPEAQHGREVVRCGASSAPWRTPPMAPWLLPCPAPPRPCCPRPCPHPPSHPLQCGTSVGKWVIERKHASLADAD
jgi:hypothetical protein